jgi:hypothetical protein
MRSLWLWLALQNAPAGPAAPPAPVPADPAGKAPVNDDKERASAKPSDKPGEPAAKPADLATARAIDTLDSNKVVAIVNGDVVTVRDVLVMWKLDGRASNDPDRRATPNEAQFKELTKEIATFRTWRLHARLFPAFVEFMTPARVDDFARDNYAKLLDDPTLTEDEKALIRERTEEELARYLVLEMDPEYRRAKQARPDDVQRFWDDPQFKEAHRIAAKATLGRLILGRELYGDKIDALARDLRQKAQEKGSLELAAQELAPGSYSEPPSLKDVLLEGPEVSLRDDVLAFAKTAQPGDLSAPISGQVSVMLFSLISRVEGHDRTFEEAAPGLKAYIERQKTTFCAKKYFVTKILTEAFFLPEDLFDEEIDHFFPGNSARRKAELARRKAQAANAAVNPANPAGPAK